MQRLVFLSAVACLLAACSEQAQTCDPTGQRYAKMQKEGTPLTEKDRACIQAILIRKAEEIREKGIPLPEPAGKK